MQYSPLIQNLVDAFRRLPGVGQKSAQRMVLHFLEKDREGGLALAAALQEAMEGVGQCSKCRTLTEAEVCEICTHPGRDHSQLCVVETPADVYAVEHSQSYRGLYFVLMGHLSPIDGIGPEELGLDLLRERVGEVGISEIIIATNPTVEGEATAYYIAEQFRSPEFAGRELQVSRIAQGVPMGGELEYVDGGTLLHSFSGRTRMVISDNES